MNARFGVEEVVSQGRNLVRAAAERGRDLPRGSTDGAEQISLLLGGLEGGRDGSADE